MFVAGAERKFRALAVEMNGKAPVAKHLGLDLHGLIEAAEARSERRFCVVTGPTNSLARRRLRLSEGAWFHGAVCAAMARTWESQVPSRLVRTASLIAWPNASPHPDCHHGWKYHRDFAVVRSDGIDSFELLP